MRTTLTGSVDEDEVEVEGEGEGGEEKRSE